MSVEQVVVGTSDGETGAVASAAVPCADAQTASQTTLDEINSKLDLLLQAQGIEQEETE